MKLLELPLLILVRLHGILELIDHFHFILKSDQLLEVLDKGARVMSGSCDASLSLFAQHCFSSSLFTDFALKMDSKDIKVHKLVMAANSELLRQILISRPELRVLDMNEVFSSLDLRGFHVDYNDLKALIRAIYDVENHSSVYQLSGEYLAKFRYLAEVMGLQSLLLKISNWNQELEMFGEERGVEDLDAIDLPEQLCFPMNSLSSYNGNQEEINGDCQLEQHQLEEDRQPRHQGQIHQQLPQVQQMQPSMPNPERENEVCDITPTDVSKLVRNGEVSGNFAVLRNIRKHNDTNNFDGAQNELRRKPVILKPTLHKPQRVEKKSSWQGEEHQEVPAHQELQEDGEEQQAMPSVEQDREHGSQEEQGEEHGQVEKVLEDESEIEVSFNKGNDLKLVLATESKKTQVAINFSSNALQKMIQCNMVEKDSTATAIPTTGETAIDSVGCTETSTVALPFRTSKSTKSKAKNKIHKCSHCTRQFKSKISLRRHERYHSLKQLICSHCNVTFLHEWQLHQHVSDHHDSINEHQCDHCGLQFGFKRLLWAHLNLYHREEEKCRRRCKLCPLTFVNHKNLIRHYQNQHKNEKKPYCEVCLKLFDSGIDKESHVCSGLRLTRHGGFVCHRNHSTPIAFNSFQELKEHYSAEHQEVMDLNALIDPIKLSCPVCSKRFLRRESLTKHLRRFHDSTTSGSTFKCSQCSKSFVQKNDCDDHEQTHKSKKEHVCNVCDSDFSSKKALIRHKKLKHEQHLSFQCEICDKVLSSVYKLRAHLLVHSNARNFSCQLCNAKFKARDNMERHLRKFHTKDDINHQKSK